jgi:putative methyltransferase (TIGR04325 family)
MPSDSAHRTFLTVALLLVKLQGSLRVIDFGAALAAPYIFLIDSLGDTSILDYCVVELPRVCEAGRQTFQSYPRIRFEQTFPMETFVPDIVYTNGAIQYVRNYKQAIETLSSYNAPFILFGELPAGDIPTFVSAQTNVSGDLPAWFFNLKEIVDMVCGMRGNYILALDSQFETGQNLSVFPPSHRIKNYHTLLFCRRDWLDRMQRAVKG